MARSPHLARFAARRRALVELVRDLPEPLLAGAKAKIDDVLAAIEKIDKRAAIAAFADELGGSAADGTAAIKYEWYYDGTEAAELAEGYTFATCKNPTSYSKTDEIDLGAQLAIESDVVLEEALDEVGSIEIGCVLRAQHRVCAKVDEYYLHLEAERRVPSMTPEQRLALPVLYDVYRNLFDITLYELLHAACSKVRDRPPYVFVGTHERWPILVGTPRR